MNWVIAYDVSADDDRARVAAVLCAFGDRVQKSVFECNLDQDELAHVVGKLQSIVKPSTDSVKIYRQCAACDQAVRIIGQAERRSTDRFWIV